MATATREDVLGYLESANMLEISDLIKDIEGKFGVTAAAPVAVAVAVPAAEAEVAEEQTEFTVVLNSFGVRQINVIKAVREITTQGLREAKVLVDGAPNDVKAGVAKEEAESIKTKLEEAGATVELK